MKTLLPIKLYDKLYIKKKIILNKKNIFTHFLTL